MAAVFSFGSCSSNDPKVGFFYAGPDNVLYISNMSSMANRFRISSIEMDLEDTTLKINRISKRIIVTRCVSIKKVAYTNIKVNLPADVKVVEYRGERHII